MKLLASPFTWIAVAAVFLFVAVAQCNRADRMSEKAQTAESRSAETTRAAAADIVIIAEVKDAQAQARAAAAENADLKAALARALAAIPGATVVGTVHSAVEGTAHGPARPQSKTCQCPQQASASGALSDQGANATPVPAASPSPDAHAGTAGAAVGSLPSPTGGPCLLADNDKLKLELDGDVLRGPSGAHYFVGTQGARRSSDGYLLLREPVNRYGTTVEEQAPPTVRRPGWSYGLGAGASDRGALFAIHLDTPPWNVPVLKWPSRIWIVGAGGANTGLLLAGVSVEP